VKTTLEIDEDVLQAAKELASREGSTVGLILSKLARKGLLSSPESKKFSRRGVPVLPSRGEIVTDEKIQQLSEMEEA
jgi:hypothetical protein